MTEAIEKLRELTRLKAIEKQKSDTKTEKRFREWRERKRKQGQPILG